MDSCYEGCKPATKVYQVSYDDFPFMFKGKAYYRFDLAYKEEEVLIRATTTDKAMMASSLVFLNAKEKAKYAPAGHFQKENNGDFRFHYYRVSHPLDPETKNYNVNQADYLEIIADYPGLILVQNPFK